MELNVYVNTRQGGYSGGVIAVAAHTLLEAHGVMCASVYGDNYLYLYPIEGWKQLENVVANVDEPQILIENGYTE